MQSRTRQFSGHGPARLSEVAERAGVSLATASRALDPHFSYVTDAVRQRVLEAASALDYHPNVSARATSGGTTPILVILVSGMQDPGGADLLYGVMERGADRGLLVMIAEMGTFVDETIAVIRRLREMKPQALVLAGARIGTPQTREVLDDELDLYAKSGGRVVIVGDSELAHDSVLVARSAGAYDLVTALAGRGYHDACVITHDSESAAGQAWLEGIVRGGADSSLRVGHAPIRVRESTRDAGYAAMRALLLDSDDPDVVITSADMIAIGAMRALRDAGRMPGVDIGVAGFGNVVGSSEVLPSLTTVDLALASVGQSAVDLAVEPAGVPPVRIPGVARVIMRDSTPER